MEQNQSAEKTKVLFITQEILPYIDQTIKGTICRYLPQGIQERNKEIRTFMPKFGLINELRNQLHEVIRLSGMNLIIDDVDHPIIIKVASISQVRIQIYFIDNDEYFKRKFIFRDASGTFFDDNDERSLFFCRSVLETVKKLGWAPNIVNCHGWMAAFAPLYVNKMYRDNPLFTTSKVVTTIYEDDFQEKMSDTLYEKLKYDGLKEDELAAFKTADYITLMKSAIDNSDAIIFAEKNVNPILTSYVKSKNLPYISYNRYDIDYLSETTDAFFDEIIEY